VPEDDGAADHLPGVEVPPLAFRATTGGLADLAELAGGTLVAYVYPQTGVPGRPVPAEWDPVPGARGCTPQSCAFRDMSHELRSLGAEIVGISTQAFDEQREFATRNHLPYRLLNDSALSLATAIGLPTFEFGGDRYYRRLTFVARAGRIATVFYPVFPPEQNANDVAAWLRGNAG
jgi:peroxiredoxin